MQKIGGLGDAYHRTEERGMKIDAPIKNCGAKEWEKENRKNLLMRQRLTNLANKNQISSAHTKRVETGKNALSQRGGTL